MPSISTNRPELTPELSRKLDLVRAELRCSPEMPLRQAAQKHKVVVQLVRMYAQREGWLPTPDKPAPTKAEVVKRFKGKLAREFGSADDVVDFLILHLSKSIKTGKYNDSTSASLANSVGGLYKLKELLAGRATERIAAVGAVAYPTQFYKACKYLRELAVIDEVFPEDAAKLAQMIDTMYAKAKLDRRDQFIKWAQENQLAGDPELAPEPQGGVTVVRVAAN